MAEPVQQPQENPVVGALSTIQAFILQQKEGNRPNADKLMEIFKALLETIKGGEAQPVQAQPVQPQEVGMRGNPVQRLGRGQRGVNQTGNSVQII